MSLSHECLVHFFTTKAFVGRPMAILPQQEVNGTACAATQSLGNTVPYSAPESEIPVNPLSNSAWDYPLGSRFLSRRRRHSWAREKSCKDGFLPQFGGGIFFFNVVKLGMHGYAERVVMGPLPEIVP